MRYAIETGVEVLTLTNENEATPNKFVLLDPDGEIVHSDQIFGIQTAGNYVFHWLLARPVRTAAEDAAVQEWLESEESQQRERPTNHPQIAQAAIARWALYWVEGDDAGEELARGEFGEAIAAHAQEILADYRAAESSGDGEGVWEARNALQFLWFRSLQDWEGDAVARLLELIGPDLCQQFKLFSPYDLVEETEDGD